MQDFDGDPAADVAALYRRTWPRLIGVLVSIGGSRADAEEVAQDAYVKLLSRWDSDPPVRRPGGLGAGGRRPDAGEPVAAAAGRDACAAKLRGRSAEVRGPDGEALDVAAALARITPAQRAVVVLHHVMDLPIEQIAEELQLPPGTVKSRLARARQALAPLLAVKEVSDHA